MKILILFAALALTGCKVGDTTDDYRNFYGVVWRGSDIDNVRYAKQMGYSHIANHGKMRTMPEARGLKFYIINPEVTTATVNRRIDITKPYSDNERIEYESILALKSDTAHFPQNVATGWWFNKTESLFVYDYQQQSVIDMVVELAVASAKKLENPENDYLFAGIMWDVQDLRGDFWTGPGSAGGKFTQLSQWTGKDSCASTTHQHDHATYRDGKAEYYKQLYRRIREEFPDAKFVGEPFLLYPRWIEELEARQDGVELMPDMLVQEANGLQFAEDRNFDSGLITRDRVGSTTPRAFDHSENLLIAATAAMNGSWYNWFGKFGGDGDMPNYQNISDVPARLQLIRMIPGWDNLWFEPLSLRSWDDGVYSSKTSYADTDIIYSRQPLTQKIFAVFLSGAGRVKLHKSETLVSVMRTNGLFIETVSGMGDIEYANNEIQLVSSAGVGHGYIIVTKSKDHS